MKTTPRLRLLAALFLAAAPIAAQPAPTPHVARAPLFDTAALLLDTLETVAALPESRRHAALDALWERLARGHQIPFAVGDTAVLLFRGEAKQVAWAGDFTGWQPRLAGTRLPGTDLWYRAVRLPADARMDYKLVLDGSAWQLDPANPLQVWSGFGPNSELRMPDYRYPLETVPDPAAAKGTLAAPVRMESAALGYAVQYRVYTPVLYSTHAGLPTLYVTDGHEYAPDHLGGLVATLDNLIGRGDIEPVVAVFIDPRNPDSLAHNRREQEFLANPKYVAFVADELRPTIEKQYRVRQDADGRVVLGTSFGGFFATYLGAERPDLFRRLAIQSPAYWPQPDIVTRYEGAPAVPYHITLSQGTVADGDGGTRLADVLARNGYTFSYQTRNEGHSWGHWRALLPHVLRYHFAPTAR